MNKEENYWNLSNQAAQIKRRLKLVDRIFNLTLCMVGVYLFITFPLRALHAISLSYVILLLVIFVFFLYRMKKRDRAREIFMRIIQIYNMQITLWKDEEDDVLSTDKKNQLKALEEEKFTVIQFFQELIWLSFGSSESRKYLIHYYLSFLLKDLLFE